MANLGNFFWDFIIVWDTVCYISWLIFCHLADFTFSKVGHATENESCYIAVSHFPSDDRQSKVGRVTENEQRPKISEFYSSKLRIICELTIVCIRLRNIDAFWRRISLRISVSVHFLSYFLSSLDQTHQSWRQQSSCRRHLELKLLQNVCFERSIPDK